MNNDLKAKFSGILESFKASKDAAVDALVRAAEESTEESQIDALARIANIHASKKKATERLEKQALTERSISTFVRVLGTDNDKIQKAISEWSRHSPKKSGQVVQYLTTGRAPGESETACYAPLFESMARGELAEMTRVHASESIRKFRVSKGQDCPRGPDYCKNNYNSFLTLLSAPDKGFALLRPRYEGRSIVAWSLTDKGRWVVDSAMRARGAHK
jgi:hypothetical protein